MERRQASFKLGSTSGWRWKCCLGISLALASLPRGGLAFAMEALVRAIRDRKSSPEQVSAAAAKLRDEHLLEEPGDYRYVLNALTKRTAWQDALGIWDEMRWIGSELEELDFLYAMGAFARGKHWQEAVEIFSEMLGNRPPHLSLGRHRESLQADVRGYTAAIKSCKGAGAWQVAVQILQDMEDVAVTPDVMTYNTVMSACEKGRDYDAAERVMSEMCRWAVPPDRVTYGTLISACGWGQQWQRAIAYLRILAHEGGNACLFKNHTSSSGGSLFQFLLLLSTGRLRLDSGRAQQSYFDHDVYACTAAASEHLVN
ncbi:unnamed protein product [Symbiodinium natans]|uniref:Pentatricopeptide repeat-containing protein n=1 Tax=Symbiodinium natans TaxID=878477 RepID=A0A812IGS7_9DINO|nr:unnamed protein product [Symbiodinium natans]